ncbi:MAG: ABC transporter substrate-binding protein [Acidimicrobiaceae bacterium]|nr:ABC transporter substrate-binding protein [Acidimicrobiaceae bacterium]
MTTCKHWTRILVALLAFAMFAAACGSSDDDSTAEEAPSVDASGTGTDPSDSDDDDAAATDDGGDAAAVTDDGDDAVEAAEDSDDAATTDDAVTDDAPPSGGVLTIDIDSGPQEDLSNFNPYMIRKDRGMVGGLAEPLFLPNLASGELEPWLAESVVSDDGGLTWTVTLRDGVTWSDGEAFDSEDVVFTVEMLAANPDFSHAPSVDFGSTTAEAVDSRTVVFAHPEPSPRWALSLFGNPAAGSTFVVVPEHIWSSVDDVITFTNENPVFTGPYTVDDVSASRIVYVRDDDWWGAATGFEDLPNPSELHWVAHESEEQKVAAMDRGELDMASNVAGPTFQALIARNSDVHGWTDAPPFGSVDHCPRALHFNNERVPNADVHWAINHAIDRDALIAVAYGGAGGPAQKSRTFFPAYTQLLGYVADIEAAGLFDEYPVGEYNPDKARERLAAAGYADGEFSLMVTAVDQPSEVAMAEVIAEQLQAVGIDADFEVAAIPDFVEGIRVGRFQSVVFFLCGSVTDPYATMNYYHSRWLPEEPGGEQGGPPWWNRQRWGNDEYSAIVDEIGTLQPGDPRISELVVDAFALWLPDLPEIALVQHPQINPFTEANWTGFPTEADPYVQLVIATPAFHQILHNLEPAG